MFILQTVLEFSVAAFIIWGLFNERKLVAFEDRVAMFFKSRLKRNRKRNFYCHKKSVRRGDDRTCA